jgi:hypothetical protein
MRWLDAVGIIDVLDAAQTGRGFDLAFDAEGRFHAFFRLPRRFDPYFGPPPWATLDGALNALPDGVGLSLTALVRTEADNPFPEDRPLARAVFDHCRDIARRVDLLLDVSVAPAGTTRKARILLTEVFPLGSPEAEAARRAEEALDRIEQTVAALDVLAPEPMPVDDWARFFAHALCGAPLDLPIRHVLYSSAFPSGGPYLSDVLPCGDARVRWTGVVETTDADGAVRLWRTVSVVDFGYAVASDFFYDVLVRFPWPLLVRMDILPVRPGLELTLMKLRMNVFQALSGFGWVAGQLEREVQASNTKKSFLKIITEGARFWNVGLRFSIPVPVPSEDGREAAEAELRRRTSILVAVLRRRGLVPHVERLRQPTAFAASLPGAAVDPQRARRLMTECVSVLLPVLSGEAPFDPEGEVFLVTRHGLATTLDFFRGRPGNRNLIVTGASGSGKSFLLQYLLSSLIERYGRRLFVLITEAGGSYRRFVARYGGAVVRIGRPDSPALDPVVGVDPEDRQSVMLYARMLRQILELGPAGSPPEGEIFDGLTDLFARIPPSRLRTEEVLRRLGLTDRASTARELLRNFIFNETAFIPETPVAFIELPPSLVSAGARDDPWSEVVRSVVVRSIFAVFFARLWDPSVDYKILVADEIWTLLRTPAGRGYFDYAGRAFRKYAAGLWVASQSMGDFVVPDDPAFGRAFVTNAFYKLILNQVYTEPLGWCFEAVGLPPAEAWQAMGIRSSPGRYSEALLIEGDRMRIVRLAVPADVYAVYQTDNVLTEEAHANAA